MSIRSPALSALLVALLWTASAPAGVQLPAQRPQRLGWLQHIGGPASLLRQPLGSVGDLRPPGSAEHLRLQPAFQGDEVKLAPALRWLEHAWDLQVAAVRDTIYRVSVEAVPSDRTAAENLSAAVYSLLQTELGEPSQQECADYSWSAEDGSAVLRLSDVAGERRVTVLLTSNVVRTFTPR